MKKLTIPLILCLLTSTSAFADSASQHASKASKYSVLAGKHSAISMAQVASGVVAVPLIAVGSVGYASVKAGQGLLELDISIDENQPLVITEKTITADRPPAVMMKKNTANFAQTKHIECQHTQIKTTETTTINTLTTEPLPARQVSRECR